MKLKNSNLGINKIEVPNEFPFGKQDFKHSIVYKDNIEITPLCIFFLEMFQKLVYRKNILIRINVCIL